jgi:hypothetical protein
MNLKKNTSSSSSQPIGKVKKKNIPIIRATKPLYINRKDISKENKQFNSIEKKPSNLTSNLSHYHNNSFKGKKSRCNSNKTNNSNLSINNNNNSNLRHSINVVRKIKVPKSLIKKEIQVNTLSMSNQDIM